MSTTETRTESKPARQSKGWVKVEFEPAFVEKMEGELREFQKARGFILPPAGFVSRVVKKHYEAEMKALMAGKLK